MSCMVKIAISKKKNKNEEEEKAEEESLRERILLAWTRLCKFWIELFLFLVLDLIRSDVMVMEEGQGSAEE